MEQSNIIYRVAVRGLHCRSSVELVNLKVTAIEGVTAASVGPDQVLTVFAEADSVTPADIVRALIDVGTLPDGDVSASPVDAVQSVDTSVLAQESITSAVAETADEAEAAGVEEAAEVAAEEDLIVALTEDARMVVEESIMVDIDTPHVAASPRASLVQRIKVDVSDNYYPNRIEVIPGVPVDIEFGEGHGCLARVVFDEYGVDQDLTNGGATVKLPGLAPGTHTFTCGMRMVHGSVVAQV